MSEYVVPVKTVVRNDLYPTIEKPYRKLVFEGDNVVWGNVYGGEVVFKGNTIIYGDLSASKIVVEDGNIYILGNISAKNITGLKLYVKENIVSLESVKLVDSIVKGYVFAQDITLNNVVVMNATIAYSKQKKPLLKTISSLSKLYVSNGDLVFNEAYTVLPVLYVKGDISGEGNLNVCDPDNYIDALREVEGFFEKIEALKDPLITPPDPSSLRSKVKTAYSIPSENIHLENTGGFIHLLGEEIIYERTKIIREYIDRLKDLFE